MRTGTPSVKTIYTGSEGDDRGKLYCQHGELSLAARAEKPSESKKAKVFWAMKAARDRSEEFNDGRTKNPSGIVRHTPRNVKNRPPARISHCWKLGTKRHSMQLDIVVDKTLKNAKLPVTPCSSPLYH